MDQRNAGGEPIRQRGGYDDRYEDRYENDYDERGDDRHGSRHEDRYENRYQDRYADRHEDRYDDRSRRPRTVASPPARSGKSKALMATSVTLAVFAAGAVAVVASGVLKDDKTPAATGSAPGSGKPPQPSGAASSAAPSSAYSDQVPTVSDGTNIVRINHREVKFPSTVTGAVWSPNGTRLAYLDGDGNVATALPDGTDVHVLTVKKAGIQRANVAWDGSGSLLRWDSRIGSGRWLLAQAGVTDPPKAESGLTSWAADQGDKQPNSEYAAASTSTDAIGSNPDHPDVFRIGDVIYENAYVRAGLDPDGNGYGGWGWTAAGKGSDPAIAPDGRVAYVGTDGQLWISGASEGLKIAPIQITFGVDHPSHPAWSPDGKRVAFGTKTDVESVSADVKAGATANPTQQEDPKPGVPSYQRTALSPAVLAFSSTDPLSAALNLSQAKWTDYRSAFKTPVPGTSGAVLVPSDASAGVVTAALAFAKIQGLPLYPVTGGTLDRRVDAELTRLFGQHDKRKATVIYFGLTVPDAVASAVTAATGSAPIANPSRDAYDMAFQAELLYQQQQMKNDGGDGSTAKLSPPQVTLVVADDDRAALLVALGAVQGEAGRNGTYRIVVTKGSTVPDAAKPVLNAIGQQPVVAIGAHAAAALAASWTGKPALKITKFTGATPAALAEATLKGMPAVLKAASLQITPLTATVLPAAATTAPATTAPAGDAAWIDALLVAAEGTGPVLFSDSSSALDATALAYLKPNLSSLIHVDTLGDGTALAAGLSQALNTPIPFPVLADPKAPAASGN